MEINQIGIVTFFYALSHVRYFSKHRRVDQLQDTRLETHLRNINKAASLSEPL